MEDIIVNDEFKSDKYCTSLNELMFGRPYKPNVIEISRLLDDNGYFGRYRIELVKDRKYGVDTLIKIHVYLVDSGITYTWPFNTFFDLDTKRFGHNRKTPRGVFTNITIFKYCVRVLSLIFTPVNMLIRPLSMHDAKCIMCMIVIKEGDHKKEDWPWIISKTHGDFAYNNHYKKIIPFLSRIGLVVNNKFKIIGKDDPNEYTSNLFDINYWHNI